MSSSIFHLTIYRLWPKTEFRIEIVMLKLLYTANFTLFAHSTSFKKLVFSHTFDRNLLTSGKVSHLVASLPTTARVGSSEVVVVRYCSELQFSSSQ
jgi:hypothetical protein